jgi:membrane fusion protein (multidrug efflux system)
VSVINTLADPALLDRIDLTREALDPHDRACSQHPLISIKASIISPVYPARMRDNGLDTISDAGGAGIARTNPAAARGPETRRTDPQSTDASADWSATDAARSRWRRPLLILGPVALVVGALVFYFATGRYVTEEDAYVQAVNVSISPQVAGQVVDVAVKSNVAVRRAASLFNLDPEPYRIAVANAEAQLGIARDQAQTLIETYRARLKQIDEARASADYAQTNYERQQHLFDTGAAPRAMLDAAIRDAQTAKANLASLQREAAAALAQLGGNPDVPVDQQSTVKQAQAAVDSALRNLRLTSVVAPFEGIPHNVESIAVGAFLNAGQSAFPLVSTSDFYVEANIRETDLTYVRPGDPARLTIDAYPETPIAGKVTTLAPASGAIFALLPPQNATGNWVKVVQRIPVRLSFGVLPDGVGLRAGMSVKVSIDTGHQRTLGELWRDITAIFGG